MSNYTYRVETDPEIVIWIDKDGYQFVRQPHHPSAYMNAPWNSVEEAETWAIEAVEKFQAEEAAIMEYEINKRSALDKLIALGLTEEEARALVK